MIRQLRRAVQVAAVLPGFAWWVLRALAWCLGGRGRFTQLAGAMRRQREALDRFRESGR